MRDSKGRFIKGNSGHNTPHTKDTKLKISLSRTGKLKGELNPDWKGEKVGYRGLHTWIQAQLGKANKCEFCGLNKIPEGMKRYFQWANMNHQYRRNLEDWKQLCVKCHKGYDRSIKKFSI